MTPARDLLRADVLHPPLRGDAPRPLLAREARRDDAHVHRAGGERRRSSSTTSIPTSTSIFSNHRCHGHYLAFTDDAFGLLCEVMGKAPGVCGGKGGSQHLCKGNFYSNGVLGSIVPVATGIALAEKQKGTGAGLDGLPRRRHARRRRDVRVAQHRLALAAAGALRRREQPLRAVDAGRARARRVDRGARCGVRDRDRLSSTRPTSSSIHDAAGRAVRRIRETGAPFFLVAQHVSLQPALEVGRPARPGGDRGAAHARSAARRGRTTGRGRAARRSRHAARSGSPRRSRPPTLHARRHLESRREHRVRSRKRGVAGARTRRCTRSSRTATTSCLLGEDVLDPYGGAFKVTQGLSDAYPDRVLTTPDQRGVALRRRRRDGAARPAADPRDHVRGLHRARARPDRERDLEVPRDVRRPGDRCRSSCATPMGARRGYGPTHSPVAREAPARDPEHLRRRGERVPRRRRAARGRGRRRAAGLLHREQAHLRPHESAVRRTATSASWPCRESGGPYPALTFSGDGLQRGLGHDRHRTAACSRSSSTQRPSSSSSTRSSARLSRSRSSYPWSSTPCSGPVARTGALVTAEEGHPDRRLRRRDRRARAGGRLERSPCAGAAEWPRATGSSRRRGPLENAMLPSVEDVVDAVARARGRAEASHRARDRPHARGREHRVRAPGASGSSRIAPRLHGRPTGLRRRDDEGDRRGRVARRRHARAALRRERRGRARQDDRIRGRDCGRARVARCERAGEAGCARQAIAEATRKARRARRAARDRPRGDRQARLHHGEGRRGADRHAEGD